MKFRAMLYLLAKIMGDYNAVKKNKVGRRIGRRAAGKLTGRGLGKLFKYPFMRTAILPPVPGAPPR